MLCAKATLTAGPRHKRFKPGTRVQAVIYVKSIAHPDELQGEALTPIAARGWKSITIQGHRLLKEDHQFPAAQSAQSEAFQIALDKGIGIVVLEVLQ